MKQIFVELVFVMEHGKLFQINNYFASIRQRVKKYGYFSCHLHLGVNPPSPSNGTFSHPCLPNFVSFAI